MAWECDCLGNGRAVKGGRGLIFCAGWSGKGYVCSGAVLGEVCGVGVR